VKNPFLRKSDWILTVLGLVGLAYFAFRYAEVYPDAAVDKMISESEAIERTKEMLRLPYFDLPVPFDSMRFNAQIKIDRVQIEYLQEKFGLRKTNEIIRTQIPTYSRRLLWFKSSDNNIRIGGASDETDTNLKLRETHVEVRLGGSGKLSFFECENREDSLRGRRSDEKERMKIQSVPPNPDTLRALVMDFLARIAGLTMNDFVEDASRSTLMPNLQEMEFAFHRRLEAVDETLTVTVRVRDAKIVYFETSHTLPPEFTPQKDRWLQNFEDASYMLSLVTLVLLSTVFFFMRFRSGAIDYRQGLIFGLAVAIPFIVNIILTLKEFFWLALLMITIFGGGIIFLVGGVAVAVSSSLSREAWSEKHQTFEALSRARVWNQNFGTSLLRGILWSGILLGAFCLLLTELPDTAFLLHRETDGKFTSTGALFLVLKAIWFCIIHFHATYLLTLSAIRRRTNRMGWLYVAGGLLGLVFPYVLADTSPLWTRMTIGIMLGVLFSHILIRYDFLTLVTAAVLAFLLQEGFFMFYAGDAYQVTILGVFLITLAALALGGIFSGEKGEDILEYVPTYVRELEDKQRLAREFEIARQIQEAMLSRSTPRSDRFEIACVCDPAFEVGGDYYDFVHFQHTGRLGVVIGDVSGKGVSAAFYMTLVKGILQTQAQVTPNSTKDTLCKVNDIFYDQIQRGKFISLIYAIFDFEKNSLQLSRAGHNPVLIKKSDADDSQKLTPNGIAIGLTKGRAFAESLEEVVVPFKVGDVFVLYTDGFSEAMNRNGEEFSEERLYRTIHDHANLSAEQIIQTLQKQVSSFVGTTPQHDDMTMIVVKIK